MLEGVLGFLAGAEHVTAEGEQGSLVALEDQLEGPLVAGPHTLDELRVGRAHAGTAQARDRRDGDCGRSLHGTLIGKGTPFE